MKRSKPHRSRGHTLPELLLGLSVGLLVIAACWQAWSMHQQARLFGQALADADHQAMTVLHNIAMQAQSVGSNAFLENEPGVLVRQVPDKRLTELHARDDPQGDTLTLGRWRSVDAVDCQGNRQGTHAWMRMNYQRNDRNELRCKDVAMTGGSYQALADGIEDFQVRVAVVGTETGSIQWLNPREVRTGSRIAALDICLRVASRIRFPSQSATVTGCQGEKIVGEGRIRRVFHRLMALRAQPEWRP